MEKNHVENVPLREKLKHLSLEWILASTSHGLPSVFRTDQIYMKIIWLIAFLASTGGCAYIVIEYIITFFEYDVTVSTTIETESPTDFPAITICNLNPFYKPRALSFITSVLSTSNLTSLLTLTSIGSGNTALGLSNTVLDTLKAALATSPTLNATSRQELGFYIDEMIISCSYNSANCNSSDFQFFQSYEYGNCYTFNKGDSTGSTVKTISSGGAGNGLEIELWAGDPSDDLFVYNRGFYVVVHNQSYSPIMENEGIFVSTGMQTNIGIDRTLYFKLPSPYSSCIEDPTSSSSSSSLLYKAIIDVLGEHSYRQKFCYKLCYQKSVIKTCSCYDPEYANPFPTFGNQTISSCRITSQLECMASTKSIFEETDISSQCDEDCPKECLVPTYSTSVSTATYPTDYYLDWLLLQTSLISKYTVNTSLSTKIPKSIAKINIFYNDVSYTALTESASLTWDTLLGNIGGQLGLFIGISFLSFVELIEITFEVLRTIYLHRKETRNRNRITVKH